MAAREPPSSLFTHVSLCVRNWIQRKTLLNSHLDHDVDRTIVADAFMNWAGFTSLLGMPKEGIPPLASKSLPVRLFFLPAEYLPNLSAD